MGERHLIIGGCGFIGRNVAVALIEQGFHVTLADKENTFHYVQEKIRDLVRFDILEMNSADWDRAIDEYDVIHHYAWSSIHASANGNPLGDLISNVGSTISLLDAMKRRGAGRLIFSSSGGTVYGRLAKVPVDEHHPLLPLNAYGAGKVSAEIYLGLYRSMHGVDCRIARIANPYGSGQNLSRGLGAVTNFLYQALHNKPITIWGSGETTRDYIHISDLVDALLKISLYPQNSEYIFNIGSGIGTTLNQLVSEIERILDRKLDVNRTEDRLFDVPISILDIKRAERLLLWKPQLSLSQGLELTLKDFTTSTSKSADG
jgi:UDP-glucose 4-epimerase